MLKKTYYAKIPTANRIYTLKINCKVTINYRANMNFCHKLYKNERKKYHDALDMKNIKDNKQYWVTMLVWG